MELNSQWRAVGSRLDAYDLNTPRCGMKLMLIQVGHCELFDAVELATCHSLLGSDRYASFACLHFHEDQILSLATDNIDLSPSGALISGNNLISALPEKVDRKLFPVIAERSALHSDTCGTTGRQLCRCIWLAPACTRPLRC